MFLLFSFAVFHIWQVLPWPWYYTVVLRGKLLARVFEMQGIQIEPELAQWLEKNLAMGTSDLRAIQIYGGQPLLLTTLQVDSVARGLAEDLARCEQAK